MSPTALALLLGVDVQDVDTRWKSVEDVPAEWLKVARRRSKEASSRIGSDNIVEVLRYWIKKDLGMDVVEDETEVYVADSARACPPGTLC